MKIYPVKGRKVRDPHTGREVTGPHVISDNDSFWIRRLADGDVSETEQAIEKAADTALQVPTESTAAAADVENAAREAADKAPASTNDDAGGQQ
jgi:hypothetical protein